MAKRIEYNYEELIQALNNVKKATELKHKEFNKNELERIINNIGLPKAPRFITACINKGLFIKVKYNCYKFPNMDIIPIILLKETMDNYRLLEKRKQQHYINKIRQNDKTVITEDLTNEIDKAIELLKSNGYKVYAAVTEYKEI